MSVTVSFHDMLRLKATNTMKDDILSYVPNTNYIFCTKCGGVLSKSRKFSKSKYCIATHLRTIKRNNIQYCYFRIPLTIYNCYFEDEITKHGQQQQHCREIYLVEETYHDGCTGVNDNECVIL